MKHAGSEETLLARLAAETATLPSRRWLRTWVPRQSALSWTLSFACLLLLVAIVADAPVRTLARSLDPSVVAVLRDVTEFGNSAWSISICLVLLAALAWVTRRALPFPSDAVQSLRSAVLLILGSVVISGATASLAKNVIGRARPSHGEAQVFEFAALTFRAAWASFPSGHATTAAAAAMALAILFPRHAIAWCAIGLTAALSRAFLGVHWLSDCLAGIALGAGVSLALARWMMARGHSFQVQPGLLVRIPAAAAIDALRCLLRLGRRIAGR